MKHIVGLGVEPNAREIDPKKLARQRTKLFREENEQRFQGSLIAGAKSGEEIADLVVGQR